MPQASRCPPDVVQVAPGEWLGPKPKSMDLRGWFLVDVGISQVDVSGYLRWMCFGGWYGLNGQGEDTDAQNPTFGRST